MLINPYQPPSAPLETSEPVPRSVKRLPEREILKSWVLLIVIGGVGGASLGAMFGAIIGGVSAAFGVPLEAVAPYIEAVAMVAGLGVSYLAFRFLVNRLVARSSKADIEGKDAV